MSGSASSAEALGLPFDEAIAFFRRKLNVETETFRDLWRDQHATAFTVAGATGADLLGDLRAAVDKAIAEGGTLDEFRRDFDAIVQRHGWRHRGKPGWRSRVIFETNLKTAYAAGAWQQIQEAKDTRPYLRYSAILDRRTRPLHRRWHGTVLPVGDAFWKTHYPPNGWRCRCTVIQLSADDLAERGWQVSDPPPPSGGVPTRVRQADGTDRIESVPPGVDPAFANNVGEANLRWDAARRANEKLATLPPDMAAAVWAHVRQAAERARAGRANFDTEPGLPIRPLSAAASRFEDTAADFRDWAEKVLASGRGARADRRTIGAFLPEQLSALATVGIAPRRADIAVTARDLLHMLRAAKEERGGALPRDVALDLVARLAGAVALLVQARAGRGGRRRVVVVFDLDAGEGGAAQAPRRSDAARDRGKVVVELDVPVDPPGADADDASAGDTANLVVTGGAVPLPTLRDAAIFTLVWGRL